MADQTIFQGICLDFVGGEPETGERPTTVAENAHCDDCGREHDIEVCPKCGSFITLGYGLMFGGCGVYKFCNSEKRRRDGQPNDRAQGREGRCRERQPTQGQRREERQGAIDACDWFWKREDSDD